MAVDTHDDSKRKPLAKVAEWVEERGDSAAALVTAIAAAIYAAVGNINTVGKLAPPFLGVLIIVSLAMVIERQRRIKESERLKVVAKDVARAIEGIEILRTPTPYHVANNESVWEIDGKGDAHGTRLKKLRFTQDDVIAVVDWWRSDGDATVESGERLVGRAKPIEKTPPADQRAWLKPTEVKHTYESRGRTLGLVPLDRAYARDEECDYVVDRRVKGAFPKNPDRVWIVALESTSLVRIILRWTDRHPTEIRLIREADGRSARPQKSTPERLGDGTSQYRIEIPDPKLGERIGVEWDLPATDEQATDEDGSAETSDGTFSRRKWLLDAAYRRDNPWPRRR